MIRYRSGDLPGLEALSCQSNHVFTDHLHNGHVLWINCSGGERFKVQGNTSVLQPGCLSLIAAGVVHANQPSDLGARICEVFTWRNHFGLIWLSAWNFHDSFRPDWNTRNSG